MIDPIGTTLLLSRLRQQGHRVLPCGIQVTHCRRLGLQPPAQRAVCEVGLDQPGLWFQQHAHAVIVGAPQVCVATRHRKRVSSSWVGESINTHLCAER
jgi:hypothetical protein